MTGDKECFVICPIGSEGSEARERSDKLMDHIIEEALSGLEYSPIRADSITEPGSITAQVIEKTVESPLVIADLTDHNPNVFYELAIRHAAGKPYIQLIDESQSIPFDIADVRTIQYDFDVSKAKRARQEIKDQIEAIEETDDEFDNPITHAADMKSWRESEDPIQQNLADVLDGINNLNKKVSKIKKIMGEIYPSENLEYSIKDKNLNRYSSSIVDFAENDDSIIKVPKDSKIVESEELDMQTIREAIKKQKRKNDD